MKLLVCGGRHYGESPREVQALYDAIAALKPTSIIHGDSRGADTIADRWARRHDVEVEPFPANWRPHGPTGPIDYSAGPRRNTQMLDEGKPDMVLAAPGGSGTADLVSKAEARKIPVRFLKDR